MLSRTTHAVHVPALSLHEAAMLPALDAPHAPRPASPDRRTKPPGQGNMAGRAVRTNIKSAPTHGPKR